MYANGSRETCHQGSETSERQKINIALLHEVVAQSIKKQKGNFKQNDVVLKELTHSEGCTC